MPLRKVAIFDDLTERLRQGINPFVAALRSNSADPFFPALFGSKLRGMQGRWREYFSERHPEGQRPEQLVLEIGMHKGRSLLAMGAEAPLTGFIGMDITYKRVVMTAERIVTAGRNNLCAILGDARQCQDIFNPGELNGVVVFFPDPWSKKQRQRHNRLLNPEFCRQLARLVAPGGFVWLKTDAEDYFQEVAAVFAELSEFTQESTPPFALTGHRTTFEDKFVRLGQGICNGIWYKRQPIP